MQFELFLDSAGQWRTRLRFGNGAIWMTSEGYSSLRECEDSLASAARQLVAGDAVVAYRDRKDTKTTRLRQLADLVKL